MEYKTGSYIIRGQKKWTCLLCNKIIQPSHLNFVRIKEYGEPLTSKKGVQYFNKKYNRYHLQCGLSLTNLEYFEKELINNNLSMVDSPYKPSSIEITSEQHLRKTFESLLKRYESQNKLSYIKITQGVVQYPQGKVYYTGKKGCSDLVIFLPKGKTVFVELKFNGKGLSEDQIKFKTLIKNIAHEYICITNKNEISEFMKRLNE